MDSKVIAAIIGVGGVSVGAFLGGVGYYLKSRNERQQTQKLVLYHLLELRHLLKSSYADPKDITEEYINHCKAFFIKKGMGDDAEFPESFKSLIEQHMGNLLEAMKPRIDDSFILSYESALKELCKADPVLAFKLRGRDRITEILRAQKEYTENFLVNIQAESSDDVNQFLAKQMDEAGSKVLQELIRDIDKDISLVSWKCSVLTWAESKRVTLKKTKPAINFEEFGIDTLLENMLNNALKQSSNRQQSGS